MTSKKELHFKEPYFLSITLTLIKVPSKAHHSKHSLFHPHVCKHLDGLFPIAQERRDKSHYSHFALPETPTVRLRLKELDLQGSGKSYRMTANRGSRLKWNEHVCKKEIRGGCCLGRWIVGDFLMLQS